MYKETFEEFMINEGWFDLFTGKDEDIEKIKSFEYTSGLIKSFSDWLIENGATRDQLNKTMDHLFNQIKETAKDFKFERSIAKVIKDYESDKKNETFKYEIKRIINLIGSEITALKRRLAGPTPGSKKVTLSPERAEIKSREEIEASWR